MASQVDADFFSTGLPSTIGWIQSATVLICLCSTHLKHLCCRVHGLHLHCYMVQLFAADDRICNHLGDATQPEHWQILITNWYGMYGLFVFCVSYHIHSYSISLGLSSLFSVFQIVGSNPVLSWAQENTAQAETHLEVDRRGHLVRYLQVWLDRIPAYLTQQALGS